MPNQMAWTLHACLDELAVDNFFAEIFSNDFNDELD